MRVLVVDHDSTVLETTVRALREHFVIDAVTNKGDCMDLLRQNTFDIVVACERLEDGSGLELLSQIAKRWPATLRVFAADRERLRLLQGRLGPFELFQALSYPINPEKLLSTLSLAREAHDAHADTTTIQHIVLSGESPTEPESEPARTSQPPAATSVTRTRPRGMGSNQNTSARAPAARTADRQPRTAPRVRARPVSEAPPDATPPTSKRRAFAPPPYPSSADAPLTGDSLAEAAGMAAAARSRFEPDMAEPPGSRKAFIAGAGCAAALLAVGLIALKLSSSKPGATAATAVPEAQPRSSKAVTDQVAEVEADFEQDDFKKAQADIRALQQLAPDHPRLRFFMTLLDRSKRSGVLASREKSESGAARKSESPLPVRSESPAVARAEPPVSTKSESAAVTAASPGKVAPVAAAPGRSEALRLEPSSSNAEERQVLIAGAPTSSVPLLVPASALPDASEAPSGSAALPEPARHPPVAPPATPIASTVPASGTAGAPSPAPDARQAISDAPPPPARSSSLPPTVTAEAQLTHRVEAQYPEAALRSGIQGYVDVQFTITPQGTVTNVAVVHSDPGNIFDHAAVDAVSRWRYDPRVIDGRAVESRSQARVRFKLDSSLSH
ncbi:MAG TPA: TonB family protein [Steroidobacteraceae bacterium]|nr:TonB family protein [Steroidobacteraceae bacterium]